MPEDSLPSVAKRPKAPVNHGNNLWFLPKSALNTSRSVSACESLNLVYGDHIEVALDSVLEAGCRNCELYCVLSRVAHKAGVDKTAAKAVAAAYAVNDVHVVGAREAVILTVVKKCCPVIVVCGNGRTERDSDLLKAKLIGKPFRICLYFNSEIASPMVFSSASRPYLSTSVLLFSP